MPEVLAQFISWRDVLDIVLVGIIIYNLLLLIRETRAVQVLLGILFLAGVYFLAGLISLTTLQKFLGYFLVVLPFAIIVLFQQEIRRGLASFGRNPLLGFGHPEKAETTINEIALAATALSARRIGALIVLQRLDGLRNYIESGIAIDSQVSYDLLVNLFTPETPLHDGAVIIQNDRIAAAACFLPLTLSSELSTEIGTRHRAALGISAETDAAAVVVSEETGIISLATDGRLVRDLDSKSLRTALFQALLTEESATANGAAEEAA